MSKDENDFGEIYIIKNFVNNKYYVGQTVQSSQERFSQHIREAYTKGRREYNYCLSRAIRKYGKEAFDFSILARVPRDMLDILEEHYIDMYMTTDPEYGYNTSIGHNDTSNFKKYKGLKYKDEGKHFKDISDEDIDRILEEF